MIGGFYYWALLVAKVLQHVLDFFLDLITGYTTLGGTREERTKHWLHHEYSAQIVNIVWRAQYIDICLTSGKNFLWTHEKYVNPKYILENKNVTLYMMDHKNAYFCVSDPDVDVYDMKKYPFCFMIQKDAAKQFVILPLASFNRLGDELGDPKVPVTLVNMTARCGSTLISQMMSKVPNTRSLSEPWILHQVNNHFRKRWFSWDQARKLMQTCIRLQCKVEPGAVVDHYVLKLAPPASPMFVEFKKMFPDFKLVFNTRHPKPSIISMHKLTQCQEKSIFVNLKIFLKEAPYNFLSLPYTDKYTKFLESPFKFFFSKVWDIGDVCTYSWACAFICWRDHKEIYDHVCLYENLTKHTEQEIKNMFKAINVDQKHVPVAMEALKTDSQKGTFGKRSELPVIKEEEWVQIDKNLRELAGVSALMTDTEFKATFGYTNGFSH